ncbi:hypothetical protein [Synechococcus sp. KORDI-52]|uniref:hypothetical protein n=1 Tax=Synechococcus sp. KORDI-52 TaxID=585425 RepID=UPI0012EBBBE4|nr:hypothetical protein [Synechococcus sp. KORDI-52]
MSATPSSPDVRKLSVLLPTKVHRQLKRKALINDRTITDVVSDLIDGYLTDSEDHPFS